MLKCPDLAIYHMAPLLGANSKHSKQWGTGLGIKEHEQALLRSPYFTWSSYTFIW